MHGKSMVALVAFQRSPRCLPGDAVGVQNKTQFDKRALRRQHRFAGRGGGCVRRGGTGARRGPSLWRRMVAVPRMMTKRGSG